MNWQMIFLLSKVNGGFYDGDELPPQNWDWPTNTWFQERLRDVREKQWAMGFKKDQGECDQFESEQIESDPIEPGDNGFGDDVSLL